MQILSNRLKELRINAGYLQVDVAKAVNLSLHGYQRYERGERNPDTETLNKFCTYYNVSSDYLLGIGVYRDTQSVIKNRDLITDIICAEMPEAKFNGVVFFTMLSDFAFIRILSAYVSDIDFTDGIKIKYYYE